MMKISTLLGFIACVALTSASVVPAESEDLTRSVIGDAINKTVESLRVKLAEYDPVSIEDKSVSVAGLGNLSVAAVEASGFSNFALTSLTATVLTRTVSGTFSLPSVSGSVTSAVASSDSLGVDAEISSFTGSLVGTSLEFSLKYSLTTLQLTSLSLLLQIEGLDVDVKASLNGVSSELSITSEDIVETVNTYLSDNQDTISSALLTAINYVLSLVGSSSS